MTELEGLSKKIYLELTAPTEEDNASYQERIVRELRARGIEAAFSLESLRLLYPRCREADWKITVSLCRDDRGWMVVDLEGGDTEEDHYGLAVDLGSTSAVMQLVDCRRGRVLAEESCYNHQIAFGEDILTRIFYCKDRPDRLEEVRRATVDTLMEIMEKLERRTGVGADRILSAVLAGNTTMVHFLLGLDAFCIFQSPYSVRTLAPGFYRGAELGIPIRGMLYCYPAMANYLGGDIISGMVATDMYRREGISLFFDVGTNGELVVGNRDFLLCGAGAAGPALEGGVVLTGMRAAGGAVQGVRLEKGEFHLDVIGGGSPVGICGSGIVDLIAELFLAGWIDLRGEFDPESGAVIEKRQKPDTDLDEYAVCYAPGLWFFESDIQEFIQTKAAAATMMEYMLEASGISGDSVETFYMAGAFGSHIRKESAVTIGMYPDVARDRIVQVGNSSLEGARRLLLDGSILEDLDRILGLMSYVQFGAVDNFVEMMSAASALPHTDGRRYPTVMKRLREAEQTGKKAGFLSAGTEEPQEGVKSEEKKGPGDQERPSGKGELCTKSI